MDWKETLKSYGKWLLFGVICFALGYLLGG